MIQTTCKRCQQAASCHTAPLLLSCLKQEPSHRKEPAVMSSGSRFAPQRSSSVVIIGGGSTSALSAVRLAEQGFQVTVLEKARCGNGSSSRSAAGIRAQFGVEETVLGMRYSEWWYAHFHDHVQTPPERRLHPVMRQNGYLFLYEDPEQAATPDHPSLRAAAVASWQQAQAHAAMQQRLGHPV